MRPIDDEDAALVRAALDASREKSREAWELLVRRYETRIYNQALRLTGNSADAMDLVQEVFIGVFRNLHRFRGESKFSSWVFRIVHNKAVDSVRRWRPPVQRSNFDRDDELDALPARSEDEPERSVAQAEHNADVRRLLSQLPIEQRLLIELKIFQSLTFEEIAELQGISDNTAKTRFYTALKKLKSYSENENGLSSD